MFRIILSIIFCFLGLSLVFSQSSFNTYLRGQDIVSITSDEKKNLYISVTDTTYFFDGLNFIHSDYKQKNGSGLLTLINDQIKVDDKFDLSVSGLTACQILDNRIIFTNKTSRLYQLYEDKILRYLIPDLEEQNLIINKLVGSGNYLLICTLNDGLYIWKHKEFILDKLNYSQGLKTNNINDAFLDDWGNLWIATDYGLQKINYLDKSAKSYPHVTIDKINVLYEEVSREELSVLDESQNSLQFHYSARDYSGSQNVSYEWRLKVSDNWQAINENILSLSTLKPGDYNLELRATNGNGLYGYALPISFDIKSSSINAAWRYVLGGVGVLSLLWLWSLSRYNRSVKTFAAEKKKLRLQNDLLKTEQKALQLQMNPHFVFNALNSIQGLIATNENQSARRYLNKFSTMMRSMLEQSRGDAISLDKEVKYLDDYLSLERMGKEEKFDFKVNKSELVQDVDIPSMLVQPFVENAIVHGLKGLDEKGMITVNFKMVKDNLICEIDDNGVGRKTNNLDKEHQSLGMQVVRDRLSKYSKFKNYQHLEIIDKKKDDGTNAGTKIIIKLPQL